MRPPRLRWVPARRSEEGAAGPRPSSWRYGEQTSEPRAGTRSRAGGLETPRGGAGGRQGTRGTALGGVVSGTSERNTKGSDARRWSSWGGTEPRAGSKIRDPWGRGFALGPHPLPGFGSRLPEKCCGRQTEARGGKRLWEQGWRWRRRVPGIAGLRGAQDACVIRRWEKWKSIRAQDSGSFHRWAVLGRPQVCQQVCTLILGAGVSGPPAPGQGLLGGLEHTGSSLPQASQRVVGRLIQLGGSCRGDQKAESLPSVFCRSLPATWTELGKVCLNTSRDKEVTTCQKGDQSTFESLHLLGSEFTSHLNNPSSFGPASQLPSHWLPQPVTEVLNIGGQNEHSVTTVAWTLASFLPDTILLLTQPNIT